MAEFQQPEFVHWIREVRRIAVERYDFTVAKAAVMFNQDTMEDYYWKNLTPEKAIIEELGNGE